ncbi:MAG: xanthine dehydrogenase family protein molybdopterin-binding subunit [Reyranellaceae bacterium]
MGQGQYVADLTFPGLAHAAIVRSGAAHAELAAVDIKAAMSMPGVIAIMTFADIADLQPIPCLRPVESHDGRGWIEPPRYVLAKTSVRHVGEAIAMVIAESETEAQLAADAVEISYEEAEALTAVEEAIMEGAPQLYPTHPNNICFDWRLGSLQDVDARIAEASYAIKLKTVQSRVVGNPIETRQAIGHYDPSLGQYTLWAGTQSPHYLRDALAEKVLQIPKERLRLISPDVGGGFGPKHYLYPEYALVLSAAKQIGRPIKWNATRSEAFLSDTQGRDYVVEATMALNSDLRIVALKVDALANMGAYLSTLCTSSPTGGFAGSLPNVYDIASLFVRSRGVFTNTVPVDAYRGAGRSEAVYVIERLIDRAARDIGVCPAELRKRNLVSVSQMPFRSAAGHVYDSGDFHRSMSTALELSQWSTFGQRRLESRDCRKLRGIGVANYLEHTSRSVKENASIGFAEDGTVRVRVGTQSTGQDHASAYSKIVARNLGIPPELVQLQQGDTDLLPFGFGTGGSRSLMAGGNAVDLACKTILRRSRKIACVLLECQDDELEYSQGAWQLKNSNRHLPILEIAKICRDRRLAVEEGWNILDVHSVFEGSAVTYPNGCHVCEVEIDPETGEIAILNYSAVDDFGQIISSSSALGQVHGGVAQGIGQALFEQAIYDRQSGQLLTGSFMDYAMPRAEHLPIFRHAFNEVPCLTNPIGVKGAGESGAIAAPPAVVNAVVDAVWELGIRELDMPITPSALWRLMQSAKPSELHRR